LLQRLPAPSTYLDVDDGFVQLGWTGYEYHFKARITRMADLQEERERPIER
jgi:hypothetical protein